MPAPDDDILAFRDAYWDYKNQILEPSEAAMRTIFVQWRIHQYWAKHHNQGHVPGLTVPSPVQRVNLRIKRLESVENKIRRHRKTFREGWSEASFRKMDDALGCRIAVYFLSDFTLIHNELHSLDDLEISSGTSVPMGSSSRSQVSTYRATSSRPDRLRRPRLFRLRRRPSGASRPKRVRPQCWHAP